MKTVTMNLLGLVLLALHSNGLSAETPEPLPHAFDAGWKGAKTCEVLYETAEVRVGKCSFPPGVGHEKHFHNPHYGYVLEGATMLISDANGASEVVTVTGNTWSQTERTEHAAINTGETTASYLIVEPKIPAPAHQ